MVFERGGLHLSKHRESVVAAALRVFFLGLVLTDFSSDLGIAEAA